MQQFTLPVGGSNAEPASKCALAHRCGVNKDTDSSLGVSTHAEDRQITGLIQEDGGAALHREERPCCPVLLRLRLPGLTRLRWAGWLGCSGCGQAVVRAREIDAHAEYSEDLVGCPSRVDEAIHY